MTFWTLKKCMVDVIVMIDTYMLISHSQPNGISTLVWMYKIHVDNIVILLEAKFVIMKKKWLGSTFGSYVVYLLYVTNMKTTKINDERILSLNLNSKHETKNRNKNTTTKIKNMKLARLEYIDK